MEKKILKNSAYLFSAHLTVKVISFFYTIFLAGSLGVANFGFYTAALAYFSLLSVISDFGFNRFLIREGARNEENLPAFLQSTLILRIAFTLLLLLIFIPGLLLLDRDITRVNLSILIVLAVLPQSLALTFDAVLVAKQKITFSAFGLLGLSLSTVAIGVYLVTSGYSYTGAALAIVLGQLFYALIIFVFLRKAKINVVRNFHVRGIKAILKGSLPYGLLGVLGLLYFKVDTLLLSYIKGAEQTGLYGVAYRFLEAIVFVPSALATAMFPVLAKLHDDNIKEVKRLYFSSLKILGLLSLVILAGYFFILPFIIAYFLPQYLPSIEAIKILSFSIPFMFLHVPGALVLISSEKFLKPVILLSFVTLGFNIALNLLLIPGFGFIGASYVTVFSEILSFVVFFTLLYFKLLRHA